jgi:hypothetical protein
VEADVSTRVLLLLVLALVPARAHAQTGWDVTATGGLFVGYTPRPEGSSGYQDLWFQNVHGGVILGRHLTPQLKLELEATGTTTGTQYRERLVYLPTSPYPYSTSSELATSVRSIGGAVTWQFGRNEWVHPFVHAGVSTDFDHVTTRTWEQLFVGNPGVPPQRVIEERRERSTTTHVRALLGGGAKVYFTPRGFVRTDARWTFDANRHNVAMRIGVGLDF